MSLLFGLRSIIILKVSSEILRKQWDIFLGRRFLSG